MCFWYFPRLGFELVDGWKDLEPRRRGVWARLRPLRAQVEQHFPSGRKPLLHTFHKNTEQDTRRSAITVGGAEKKRRRNEGRRDVRWWSVLRKRLALRGRRGQADMGWARCTHGSPGLCLHARWAAEIRFTATGSRLSACIHGHFSANIMSPSGNTRSEHYAGRAALNGRKDQAHFLNSPCWDRSSVSTKWTLSTKISICGQTLGHQGNQQPLLCFFSWMEGISDIKRNN